MGVRKTVFGSDTEKHCYRKLSETWAKDYHLYHNLPFLNVFSCKSDLFDENLVPFRLSDTDYDRLKKTSIDFTLCDKRDRPLICVEFDGMQDGFNIGTTYHLRNGKSGRKGRRAFLELKLRVAHGSNFTYLVLGSAEFCDLSDSLRITIADGLIGEVMSLRAFNKRVNKGFDSRQYGYSEDEFRELLPAQQSEILDDWLIMLEVESDYKYNPVAKEVMRLSKELHVNGHCMTFLNDGCHDPTQWVWVEYEVSSGLLGSANVKICMPNFNTPYCYYPIHVAIEVANLMALEQLRKRLIKNGIK
jgi:hypothetical protein